MFRAIRSFYFKGKITAFANKASFENLGKMTCFAASGKANNKFAKATMTNSDLIL